MSENVNIAGLSKADVLRALFNNSRPQGLGFLAGGAMTEMAAADAEVIASKQTCFDYVRGRVMKVDISGDEMDPWGYDRDNGPGAAQRAIATLK